jgi:CHAT domain-containing protein/tetratricopeptide (TPR) repeat protein
MSYQNLVIIGGLTVLSTLISLPTMAAESAFNSLELISQNEGNNLENQAKLLYEKGDYQGAIDLLTKAITGYGKSNNLAAQIVPWRNLALLYAQIGDVKNANNAINYSIQGINYLADNYENKSKLLAQSLDVQGQIYLSQGNPENALSIWQKSAEIYHKIGDLSSFTIAKVNQVQALQNLGLYNKAMATLQELNANLAGEKDSLVKAKSLLNLGSIYSRIGKFQESEDNLTKSLAVAEEYQSNEAKTEALISLGNNRQLQGKNDEAIAYYQKALESAPNQEIKSQIELNKLSILVKNSPNQAKQLATEIEEQIGKNPLNKNRVTSRLKLGTNLMKMGGNKNKIIEQLSTGIKEAQQLKDKRSESYGLGTLAKLYEQNQRYSEAEKLTSQALLLAQEINASEIIYQWQWQLGRNLKNQDKNREAINAYTQSLKNLQAIRTDLIAISSDVQFSFKESVEPVYRELVNLLLQPAATQEDLRQARQVIEDLQLAELDNFFNDACLDAKPVNVDALDRSAAIFYTVIMEDRLEVVLAIPGQPLVNYRTYISAEELRTKIGDTRVAITGDLTTRSRGNRSIYVSANTEETEKNLLPNLEYLYNSVIKPAENILSKNKIKNLVFIQDGSLRNLPMSALYDGNKYLIEKYNLSLAPSLQLIDPNSLNVDKIDMFSGGLSEARQGFSPLPGVKTELDSIEKVIPTKPILDGLFTESNINKEVKNIPYQIVHLATHGVFSSNVENTFILTYDDKININELNALLRREKRTDRPIELLVLSACQTAVGDERAALGLAGVAVRAGARSTIASLWSVSDEATVLLMTTFYRELAQGNVTKSEAFRRAQIAVLKTEEFSNPYYWSAFLLLGNWL